MSMKSLPAWAQKLEIDGEVLPFNHAQLTIGITSEGVIFTVTGETHKRVFLSRRTLVEEKVFDPNTLHTVTLTLNSAATPPLKRPTQTEDTVDEVAKICMAKAQLAERGTDNESGVIHFLYTSRTIAVTD